MNLRQIEAFRAVMVTGSATEAGKMLFISQPAISRLIADLEHRANLKLFVRKPNRLEPTPEAQALYREVDRAFIGLEEISRTAEAIANKQHGSLRIVAMPVCVDSFLPPLISEFSKQHPHVSIELESAPRIQALDLVRSQRLDLGIVSLTRREDVGLQVARFCQQQAVCVLPASHRLADKAAINVQDLAHEPVISLSRGSPFRARFDEIFARAGITPTITIETRTQRTIYELVQRGAGVAILDPLVTDSLDSEVVIKPFVPEVTWDYAVVQPDSAPTSLITQSFITLLMAHFHCQDGA
ncbi:MAG: LysR substrate-binding domain-containing protein [Motiliproteus sp.]